MVHTDQISMTTPTFDAASVEALAGRFAGSLIQPGNPDYDETRRIWNGMIDKRPALIARCTGVSDVIQAVNFAREHNSPPSIRGGGHNVAGHAVSDGGLMIDLSLMRAVHVDPSTRVARVEGGATWSDFEREAAVFGLSTTGGVISTTGVAGLTLGGGIGWLVGKYGLTIDNLLAVDLVTADGLFRRASSTQHPDLFWALCGGGGNFGIATSFEFQLHPVDTILGGILAWPVTDARAISEFYRTFTSTNPEQMTTYLQFVTDPDSGQRIVVLAVFWPGDVEEGQQLIDEIRAFREPIVDMVDVMPYRDWQVLFDGEFPAGARYYWKSVLLKDISDEIIDAIVEQGATPELESCMVIVEHYRGTMNRVNARETAFSHRDAEYQVVVNGKWFNAGDDETGIAWARRLNASIEAHSTGIRFLNFNAIDAVDKTETVRASFGPNYVRLAEIKRRYDPENLFRQNNNIRPA